MGSVKRLAEEVTQGLREALSGLRKTVVEKLSLAAGAMIEAHTPNTAELTNVLPLDTERQDMREQWLRRRLSNPLVDSAAITVSCNGAVTAVVAWIRYTRDRVRPGEGRWQGPCNLCQQGLYRTRPIAAVMQG